MHRETFYYSITYSFTVLLQTGIAGFVFRTMGCYSLVIGL